MDVILLDADMDPPRIYRGTSQYGICNSCDHEGSGFRPFTEPLSVDDAICCRYLACPRCNHGSLDS